MPIGESRESLVTEAERTTTASTGGGSERGRCLTLVVKVFISGVKAMSATIKIKVIPKR